MGLLKLLTFPITGPVTGTQWVLQTVLDEAERRQYDPSVIRQEMADLEAQHRAGRISDDEFDRREEGLLERLLEARRFHEEQRTGR